VGVLARGLANNGMTDAERSALSQDDPEYAWRYAGTTDIEKSWSQID
jgi:hypothetical protein